VTKQPHQSICLLLLTAGLFSCQPTQQPPPRVVPAPQPAPVIVVNEEDAAAAFREELRQQLLLADLLHAGLRALAADRLMTPAEGSALSIFNRVLMSHPDNQVAQDGIRDIAGRYLELADMAARQGNFSNAQLYLRRAESVYPGHQDYAATTRLLDFERQRTHSVHTINAGQLNARSDTLVAQLQEIAVQVRDQNFFLMITAPNDTLGRWIYAQMQGAVEGYRLRADIEIGEQPAVRLVLPQAASNS
jgi:hypothetical protein